MILDNVRKRHLVQGVVIVGARYSANGQYPGTRADFVRVAQDAATQCGFKVKEASPEQGWVKARAGFGLRSWGENIDIRVNDGGGVEVISQCLMPTQFIDYGKNKSNVNRILARLSAQ
jgi:hypothetical protein